MLKAVIKPIPKSIMIVCLLIIPVVTLIGIAWKPLWVLNLQARGGENIENFIQSYAPDLENYFTCQIPALTTLPEDEGLAQAVVLLEKAKTIRPQNEHTDLLLGKAYCLQKEYEDAIEALEDFNQERPDNPIGDLERAFAHFTLTLVSEDLAAAKKHFHKTQSRVILEDIGYSREYFIAEGNTAYLQTAPIAWYWYHLGQIYLEMSETHLFRLAIMDLVFSNQTEFSEYFKDDLIIDLEEAITIQPSSFFRLKNGASFFVSEMEFQSAGRVAQNNDPGGILLNVKKPGHYCLSVSALDLPPQPTKIEFTVDFIPLSTIELINGDRKWRLYDMDFKIDEGLHLISFRLLNDAYVNGIDRNGNVGEISISRCGE